METPRVETAHHVEPRHAVASKRRSALSSPSSPLLQMRNGRRAATALSCSPFFPPRFFSSSPPPPAPADDLANLLLIAAISKAFSRPGVPVAADPPIDPAAVSDAVVLQVLRRPSLHPAAKAGFLRWASSLPTYRPSPAAFSELLRSHCRAGLLDALRPVLRLAVATSPGGHASLEPDVLKLVLDALIRSGRIDAAIDVLDDVEAIGGAAASAALHPRMYNSVVLALLKKSQLGLALSMFRKLLEASAGVEHLACNELLVALRRADMRDDFMKVFGVLMQRGFRFDTWGYNICIHSFGCWGQLDVALRLFKEMKENGSPEAVSDICTYNSLLRVLCSAGKVHDALMVYAELKGSGHEPDQFTYRTLIEGCCKVYRLDDAIRVFGEMEYNNVRADTVVYNSLLDGLLKAKKIADACQLFERMVSEGVRASCYTYNILIDGLFRNGRPAAAFTLFCDLKKKGQFVDSISYSIVVMHFCREGQVDRALESVEEMEKRGFSVDLVTVTTLLVGLHKCGRWDWAERLMKHVRDSNLAPNVLKWTTDMEVSMRNQLDRSKDYTPLFPAIGNFDDIMRWINPSSETDSDDVCLDGECKDTWSSSPYMDKLADKFETFKEFPKFSVRKGMRVQQKGISSFDIDMVNTYLSIFLAKGKLNLACKLFEIFTEMDRDLVSYTYNSLMSSFVKKGYFNVAWGVLQDMGDNLCPADIATYNVIIQGLGKMGKAELASAVLEQLMKKGGYLDIVMYNTLIHALGKAGRFDEANKLFKQMTGSGINPDVVTFNTLIEVHAKAGRVKDAYKFLRMMLDAGCSPNHVTDTILDFLEKEIEKLRDQNTSIK